MPCNLTFLLFYVSYLYNAHPSVRCVCHVFLLSHMMMYMIAQMSSSPEAIGQIMGDDI